MTLIATQVFERIFKKPFLRGFSCALFIFPTLVFLEGCGTSTPSSSSQSDQILTPLNLPAPTTPPGPSTLEVDGKLSGTAALDLEELRFLELLNQYRVTNGASVLIVSQALTAASDWMSNDMASKNYFSHTDLQGRSSFTRMKEYGYTGSYSMAENIAAGNETGTSTFNQWKNSAGHNANMLNPIYRSIGVGRAYSAQSNYRWYWTTDFGGR